MTTTSEKILKTIKETHVKPQPKWRFLVRNWLTLGMFGLALLVGALSFAVMLDIIVRHDWDIYFYLHKTFAQYVLLSLPYVWMVVLALFFGVAYYDFIHIRGWYRHRVYLVVAASIFLSFGLGLVFFFAGFGKTIDRTLAKRVPFYKLMRIDKEALWNHPEEGLLEGEIIQVGGGNEFLLQDYSGRLWRVQISNIKIKNEIIDKGENVEMIGAQEGENIFVAKNIREADTEREDEFLRKRMRPPGPPDVCVGQVSCGANDSDNGSNL
jgi:hypothetical protein